MQFGHSLILFLFSSSEVAQNKIERVVGRLWCRCSGGLQFAGVLDSTEINVEGKRPKRKISRYGQSWQVIWAAAEGEKTKNGAINTLERMLVWPSRERRGAF